MKKLLFFPQNETHLANMLPVAEQLEKAGVSIFWLNASELYHQYIYKNTSGLQFVTIDMRSEKPFYGSGIVQQLKLTHNFRKEASEKLTGFDGFVIGNDGALQRAAYSVMRGTQLFYVLDGIITDNTFSLIDALKYSDDKLFDFYDFYRRKWKLLLIRFLRHIPFDYYLPSEMGTVRAERYYVMGSYVKQVLADRGIANDTILVSGLPRFAPIFEINKKSHANNIQQDGFTILLLTQSWAWHNDYLKDKIQHEQFKKIFSIVDRIRNNTGKSIKILLRIHPRDDAGNYDEYFKKYSFLHQNGLSLYDQVLGSDIVLGVSSTVLIEASALKKYTGIIMLMGQYWRFKRSFLSLDCFLKFLDEATFEKTINDILNAELIHKPDIDNLISPDCANAHVIIADDILKHLN